MARMHSKKRGRSGSKRPPTKTVPEWVETSATEVEEIVASLGKKGVSPAMIGQTLRDEHGIPSVKNLTGKALTEILEESEVKMEYPADLLDLIKRAMGVRKHLKDNPSDKHNRTKLHHIESKIRRLAKYYSGNGKLPEGWRYDPEKAALIVK